MSQLRQPKNRINKNLAFFVDPPKVGWKQLSEVLNWQFSCTVGRGLSKQQLNVLRDKIVGERADDCEVSWSQFCKENMPGTGFRFWQWLDSLLVLIRKFLHPVWADGYVIGFVSEETVRELLKDKESGTFLLHFCENNLGSITFTWVERKNGEMKFTTAEPYTNYNLNATTFADIIRDYKVAADGSVSENPLKFLYPGITRDEAFGKYYSRGTE
ncbi:signal transducer and activator of transcription 4-like [Trichomycterus rosablanca]|uniref:signal transducer and activator of transcription 4-like n=1 Tax=Trichomycterus rosablanca TaxID=2290929 RepID=UPI002F35DF50